MEDKGVKKTKRGKKMTRKGKALTSLRDKERKEGKKKKVKHSLFEPPLLWTLPEGREDGRLRDI